MSTPSPDVLMELRILKQALRLFLATAQLDSGNELLIAQQTRSLLLCGHRHALPPATEDGPYGITLSDLADYEPIWLRRPPQPGLEEGA